MIYEPIYYIINSWIKDWTKCIFINVSLNFARCSLLVNSSILIYFVKSSNQFISKDASPQPL